MSQSPITCHVIDSSTGEPAAGVSIRLLRLLEVAKDGGADIFQPLADGVTNQDGRCTDLSPIDNSQESKEQGTELISGHIYKLVFKTQEYFERTRRESFYPWVEVSFTIIPPKTHHHIPLLISPYGFTTYRGS